MFPRIFFLFLHPKLLMLEIGQIILKDKKYIYIPHLNLLGKGSSLISHFAVIRSFEEESILISSKSRMWILTVGVFMNLSRLGLIIIKVKIRYSTKGFEV